MPPSPGQGPLWGVGGPWTHLAQEVPAVGPGFTPALKLVAERVGAQAVFFLLLINTAAQRRWSTHILWVLNPVASKLGQDDQRIWAAFLHNLGTKEVIALKPSLDRNPTTSALFQRGRPCI